jgi:tetratricopeptide (TPR) repeat protein
MNKEELRNLFFEENLSEIEAVTFTELLKTNAGFAEEVAFQKAVKKQLHMQKRAATKAELKAFESGRRKIIPLNWTWISAAAVLVLGVCTWIFLQKYEPNKSLYSTYYQPFPNVTAPTVRGENDISEKSKAMNLYDAENYAAALPLFEKLYQTDSADYSYFYQGICQLELGNMEKAIALFEKTNYKESKPWKNVTDWYLALAYLKAGEAKKAMLQLQKVIAENDFMAIQAKKLIGEL